jgi:hypothetical protein
VALTYEDAERLWSRRRAGYDWRWLVRPHCALYRRAPDFLVELFETVVVTVHRNDAWTVSAGSWRTRTTMAHINRWSPARVWNDRWRTPWKGVPCRGWKFGDGTPFRNNTTVDRDGCVLPDGPYCPELRPEEAGLRWNGGCVPKLARTIYEGARDSDLPILADALEEAGCEDAGVLGRLRADKGKLYLGYAYDLVLAADELKKKQEAAC